MGGHVGQRADCAGEELMSLARLGCDVAGSFAMGHRILVADDDLSIRRLLITFLRREGYEILEAHNGREAVAQMRAGKPDMVIMDLVMPDMSGWDVLRERAGDALLLRIPILVITASNIEKARLDVLERHVCGVIAKPFDLDTLVANVTSCLEQPCVLAPAAA
jgi:DNA-binding response OmpR family regulator